MQRRTLLNEACLAMFLRGYPNEREIENVPTKASSLRRSTACRCVVIGVLYSVCLLLFPVDRVRRTTFSVDPDTHIDSLDQAEEVNIEGTSKWSCKIAITGTAQLHSIGETWSYTVQY